MAKQVRHQSRGRKLTPEEASKYRALRAQIEQEKPQINARLHARLTALSDLAQVFAELKKCRDEKGLSLADVRDLTGMDRSAISKLENGQRVNFTIDTVIRYAQALGKKVAITLVEESCKMAGPR